MDPVRVVTVNDAPVRPERATVLYWMIAQRRTTANLALDRAIAHGRALGRPVVVLEPLRVGYRWASPRHHRFILEGMADNAARCAAHGITYRAYVEPSPGEGKGLLAALAAQAAVVVTDDWPTFFLPRMVAAAGAQLDVRLEAVDGNGVVPLRLPDRDFTVAHSFRRWMHDRVDTLIDPSCFPVEDPFEDVEGLTGAPLPDGLDTRWPASDLAALRAPGGLAHLPIDHAVPIVPDAGGSVRGMARLASWLDGGLDRYADARNDPDEDVGSGLSPYLHYGHVGAHDVVRRVLSREGWRRSGVNRRQRGKNTGFWGTSSAAESFLDELITWRELGHVFAHRHPHNHDRLEANPDWALATLAEHADDPRETTYSLEALTEARTHDEVWNAAQRQLRSQGVIHNYLRMLWGKNVLAWSPTPEDAVARLVELNNRWALDGRDPNSWSGIFWTFGRFDRAWGPERPVFGKVRFMTSRSTRNKLRLSAYLDRWGPEDSSPGLFPPT